MHHPSRRPANPPRCHAGSSAPALVPTTRSDMPSAGSAFIFQLANMLFSVCMRHPIFCSHFTREGSPDSDSSAPPSCIPDAPFVRAFHRWADQVDTRGSAAAQDRPRSSGSPRVQRHSARSRAGYVGTSASLPARGGHARACVRACCRYE
eukprot:COSAG01_NODE_805_length_13443_cov_81.464928_17_plen_150_part_00